jgi:hypothetical protein
LVYGRHVADPQPKIALPLENEETVLVDFNQAYNQTPFPGRIDPWAEDAHFFHAIHAQMISVLVAQYHTKLFDLGYVIGISGSLQMSEGRDYIERITPKNPVSLLDYELAAVEMLVEPGEKVADLPELDALVIRNMRTGDLVTVVEIVSPGNKNSAQVVFAYQERRTRLYLEKGINVVEIDATRSIKRLTQNSLTGLYPYHVAIYLPGDALRIVGIEFDKPLKPIALPLRGEVTAMALHDAYQQAYQQLTIAWHIQHETHYHEDKLPFASLMTDDQRHAALQAVKVWQESLSRMQQ